MRRIKEALRLHLQAGLSYDEIGRALKISKSSAGKYVSLARAAGVNWELAQTLTDDELEARLFRPPVPRSSHQLAPDFALVHQELKRAGVTLQLLWEEYARDNTLAYRYTSFCIKYRAFAQSLKRSMRQVHIAGEKLFVDYSGDTVPLINAATGEITQAQIFVATLGASNYTYARATERQTTADWIGAQVRALEFFGGTPRLIVPDQTRSLIKYPDSYDPEPNRTYEEFAEHYGCALLAARPGHPRDKPKVEAAVLLVQRWILARLRNRRFFSLAELNRAIAELLVELNQRPFKKLPGCRASAFAVLDAPALKPLPTTRYEISRWKSAKVNIDYHVEFDAHYYSVPHRLVGTAVELRVTDTLVEAFAANQRVACHALSHKRGGHTTLPEHMPASHRAHLEWTPAKLIDWGRRIGVSTAAVVTWQLEHRPHPEQGYRACLGLKRLARQYSPARLEAACTRALAIRSPTFRSVDSILKCGLNRQPSLLPATTPPLPEHDNVRGPDYYCALAHQAARSGFSVLYTRAARLFDELQVAHGDGSFARRLAQLAKLDLLVIDDFAISPMGAAERNDLLELLDDRVGTRSTLITSQLPVKAWHTYLDDPTLADAILDRIVHSSHKIELKGKSLRDHKEDK